MQLRLRSDGRGTAYTVRRGVVESCLRTLYRGDWPAKLWGLVPGACDVDLVAHRIAMLPEGARSLRVGFVSDLHVGPTTPERLLDNAFAHLASAQLDVLLLGGDYVFLDADERAIDALAARIGAVSAARKLAVLGNHDLWTRHELLERSFAAAGVEVLVNRSTALAPEGEVTVVGLDDPWTGAPDAARAFEGTGDAAAVIVLCHSPNGLPLAQAAQGGRAPTLYVCGHTHGGHIATPWGPLIVPGRLGRQYPSGLHSTGDLTLYVSRGVGGVELPVRAYARPEVVVFTLTAWDRA